MDSDEVQTMKVTELRDELGRRGLDKKGLKSVLQSRLLEAIENEKDQSSAPPAVPAPPIEAEMPVNGGESETAAGAGDVEDAQDAESSPAPTTTSAVPTEAPPAEAPPAEVVPAEVAPAEVAPAAAPPAAAPPAEAPPTEAPPTEASPAEAPPAPIAPPPGPPPGPPPPGPPPGPPPVNGGSDFEQATREAAKRAMDDASAMDTTDDGSAAPAAPVPPKPEGAPPGSKPDDDRRDRDRDRRDRDRDRDRSRRDDRDRRDRSRDRDRSRRDGDRDRDRSRRDGDRDRRDRSRDRDRSRRDEGGEGNRRRSPSPEPAKRKRKNGRIKPSTAWDVAPPGFENITPMQYKEMRGPGGMIAPGMMPPPGLGAAAATMAAPLATASTQQGRQARRLYVGNIPFGIPDKDLLEFFNGEIALKGLNIQPGEPIISSQINVEKNFAFLEFRSLEECTKCLILDGILFRGQSLKLRRPKDYMPISGSDVGAGGMIPAGGGGLLLPPPGMVAPGGGLMPMGGGLVPDGPNKVFVGGLPTTLESEHVKELLEAFGALTAFHLVKDPVMQVSRGFAFCEFEDPAVTDLAIEGLNGMDVGDQKLTVQRAQIKAEGPPGLPPPGATMPATSFTMAGVDMYQQAASTRVLVLMNMVTEEELKEDDDYNEIVEDVREECGKFAVVQSIECPRPQDGLGGVGKIFVQFFDVAGAEAANRQLSGRKFDGRVVLTSYLDEAKYANKQFE